MQLDKKAVNRLLSLDDKQLMGVIEKLARESGIDPGEFNASADDVQSIRRALMSVSDDDLARIRSQYEAYKKNAQKKR